MADPTCDVCGLGPEECGGFRHQVRCTGARVLRERLAAAERERDEAQSAHAELTLELVEARNAVTARGGLELLWKSQPVAYFATALLPMLECITKGTATNHVVGRFVTHKDEPWRLILQRENGTTPAEKAERERDAARADLDEARRVAAQAVEREGALVAALRRVEADGCDMPNEVRDASCDSRCREIAREALVTHDRDGCEPEKDDDAR